MTEKPPDTHQVFARYTSDDDGIWLECRGCFWARNLGFGPTIPENQRRRHRTPGDPMTVLIAALLTVAPFPLPPSPTEIQAAETAVQGLATATVGATRTGTSVQETPTLPPPPPSPPGPPAFDGASSNGRCVGAEPLLAYYSPGWSVARMSQIMYRESRCDPSADNSRSSASGLLQILSSLHCPWLNREVGPCNLYNPDYNVRAAAALWSKAGYGAWSVS